MEFNIALHTIFYVSVFIVPGFLLRRFYFSGEFNKEFSQGNLMERFIWTIFGSIMVLLASSFFFILLRVFSNKKLLSAISYDTVKEIFDLLSDNKMPETNQFFLIYQDFLILIFGIYFAAILLGVLFRKLALNQRVCSMFPVLKYKNYWYYFLRGRVKSAPKEAGMVYWYTEADILVEHEGKAKMYSGKISDYFISPESNQLESIFLEDTNRYKFDDHGDYELMSIPGHTFCVPFNRMLNMNLTYVNRKKNESWKRNLLWWFFEITYVSVITVLISLVFLEDFPLMNFHSIIHKIGFLINTWILLSWVKTVLQNLIHPSKSGKEITSTITATYFIGIIISLFQYLWILNIYGFFPVFGVSILIFFLLMIKFVKVEKTDESKEEKKD